MRTVPKDVLSIHDFAWSPQYGAFQVYPAKRPRYARHALFPAVNWKRVAEEVYKAYILLPLGNDGEKWMYFG